MQTNLVIGNRGQIGSALQKILDCDGIDQNEFMTRTYDVLHIAIPYSDTFVETVGDYMTRYKPLLVIVHSTVPLGTTRKLGPKAVHSPCRGVHPDLEQGIRTFVKFFGGDQADRASQIFKNRGVPVRIVDTPETTEAMKLWDTTVYGFNILIEKMLHQYCEKNGVDFNVVNTESAQTYNEGYAKLGKPHFSKYVLKHVDGPIGGHCVRPNVELLGGITKEAFDFMENKLGL